MGKVSLKKNTDRRRKARSEKVSVSGGARPRSAAGGQDRARTHLRDLAEQPAEKCNYCAKDLTGGRSLFVEEEVGRVFCSEECITGFFVPEIERLEKEYFRQLADGDLTPEEREKFAHLRWLTLQEPDEVWCEKTLAGDLRYYLISEFQPNDRPIWCVCICLYLRNEPSFLYLAFPTRNAAMVAHYRRGEPLSEIRGKKKGALKAAKEVEKVVARAMDLLPESEASGDESRSEEEERQQRSEQADSAPTDGLADPWTEDETLRARIMQGRSDDDIPKEEFPLYEACLDETLEAPDEVWTLQIEDEPRVYHFIRSYPEEKKEVWYIIVARETEDDEQIEILDAFPTRDPQLVDCYRRGEQEIGDQESPMTNRLIH